MLPSFAHCICGTCAEEIKRNVIKLKQNLNIHQINNEENIKEYCCLCGQYSNFDNIFYMEVKDLPKNWCNGEHENEEGNEEIIDHNLWLKSLEEDQPEITPEEFEKFKEIEYIEGVGLSFKEKKV